MVDSMSQTYHLLNSFLFLSLHELLLGLVQLLSADLGELDFALIQE